MRMAGLWGDGGGESVSEDADMLKGLDRRETVLRRLRKLLGCGGLRVELGESVVVVSCFAFCGVNSIEDLKDFLAR